MQNYLTMLGSTVLIPFTLVTAMGGTPDDLAAGAATAQSAFLFRWSALMLHASSCYLRDALGGLCSAACVQCAQAPESCVQYAVIGTIFFVSGVVTLVQTFVGDRLPIIQVRLWVVSAFGFKS